MLIAASLVSVICRAQRNELPVLTPYGTYLYAHRDTCDLFLDVYEPSAESERFVEGKQKPAVLFIFGGGFKSGTRNEDRVLPYFKSLTDNGYRVISMDYRLGMKNIEKTGVGQANEVDKAIHLAVEDLFTATAYLVENAEELGISPDGIVLCGSSAGAITALQADYELNNSTAYASILPEGFRYAGVMAFAGAVFTRNWGLKYAKEPAPTLLLHGTADKIVPYKKMKFFNLGFYGTDYIAKRFSRNGYRGCVYRYQDYGHKIASIMAKTMDLQIDFLENYVMGNRQGVSDTLITESDI